MKIITWYLLVAVNLVLLAISFVTGNIYLVLFCFILALFLSRYTKSIPLPKYFEEYETLHMKKKIIDINDKAGEDSETGRKSIFIY